MPDYHEINNLHKEEYGHYPEVVVRVPGVVNMMGEHTEASQGFVMTFGVDRYALIALSCRSDNSLRFFAGDSRERKRTSIANLKYKREDRWANYPKGVLAAIYNLGFELKGINWTLLSDIPQGVGLGSSSALCAGTALALKSLLDIDLTEGQLVEAARYAESRFIQGPGYIADTLSCFFARRNQALFLDTRTLDYHYIPLPEELCFLITDSQVPPSFQEEDFPEYARSREECLEILKNRRPGNTLRDYSRSDLREGMGDFPEISRRRCLHIVQENDRVKKMRKALENGKWGQAGKLMYHSHESLRDFYEVTCPELDWLVKRAQETEGIWGARMTGAGFGGCTLTMLTPSALPAFEVHLEDYDRIFGFKADHYICRPADGACRVSAEDESV